MACSCGGSGKKGSSAMAGGISVMPKTTKKVTAKKTSTKKGTRITFSRKKS